MPSQIQVIRNVSRISGKQVEGPASYTDLAGSSETCDKPIAAGIWHLEDITDAMTGLHAEWDEVKYVVKGEITLKDESTGEQVAARAGDLIWIPTGSKSSIVSSKDLSTIYVEQRHAEWTPDSSTTEKKLCAKLAQLTEWYVATNPGSAAEFIKATEVLPGGNTRTVLHHSPFPLVLESGEGALVTSRDGTTYLDFVSEYSAAMYGHSHPKINEAIHEAMKRGINLGSVMGKEAEFAGLIKTRFPSMELMRFTNSGTEATTLAVGAALAFTGRKQVLVFQNGYHGSTMTFSSSSSPNLNLPHDFVVGTYNDIQATWPLVTRDTGAILVEPMQSAGGILLATREFLQFLRDAATAFGAVLIFDEIVTSRLDYHGLQGYWDIKPDLTALGKYIGGGFAFGCFGGRRDVMAQFDPRNDKYLSHSGTYNNNVFTMMAGIAGAKLVTAEEIARINRLGDWTRLAIADMVSTSNLSGIEVVGFGSAVGLRISSITLRDTLYFHLLQQGIVIARRGFLMFNLTHTDQHVDQLLESLEETIKFISA